MPRIVLFDIDGTLVSSGGAARHALERGFAEATGRESYQAGFPFGGMTDRAIFRQMLRECGDEDSEPRIDSILPVYLEILREEITSAPRFRVLPGVVDLLGELVPREEIALGLGTGNVEAGARTKLARGDLNSFFHFGGFGSDSESRPELLRIGAERGAAALGAPLGECDVRVVGDTPLDVAAAHALGAPCLGVATGGATAEALETAGADALFADLSDPGALAFLLEPREFERRSR